jgi:transposase-like protein
MQNNSEVLTGLVVGRKRDGRCQYDPVLKQELVRRCLAPGVSVARMAMQHGINANLLRVWIMKSQGQRVISPLSDMPAKVLEISHPFVPVQIQAPAAPTRQAPPARLSCTQSSLPATLPMRMQVRLPNGVEVDLNEVRLDDLTGVMQMLSALPCSS